MSTDEGARQAILSARRHYFDTLVQPTKDGRFPLILRPYDTTQPAWYGQVAFGDQTAVHLCLAWVNTHRGHLFFVGIEGWGAYAFTKYVDAGYVREKLRCGASDGNVADFINDQLEESPDIRQGKYNPRFCRE